MRRCSTASLTHGASWLSGATTTTTSGHTRRWGTEHRHKRAGRSCKMETSHPARLCRWGSTNIKPADSRYDRGTSGGQVTRYIVGWRVSRTAHAGFVLDALEQAIHDRRPAH